MTIFPPTTITPPAAEPVTLDEVKDHLRLVGNDQGPMLEGLIVAARQAVETYTGRQLITATLEDTHDGFPVWGCWDKLILRRSPVQEITHIKYDDEDGAEQTLAADQYRLQKAARPFVEEAYGVSWPSTRSHSGAVRVRYLAGYGDAGSDVPQSIRTALCMIVGALYEQPEAYRETKVEEHPLAMALLWTERVLEVA